MQRILVNGEEIELTDMCRWTVRNGALYNLNTNHDEGVEGDIIEYTNGGIRYRGHVDGYTCYQFVDTKEWGKVILSAKEYAECGVKFTHVTPVTLLDEAPEYKEPEPIEEEEIVADEPNKVPEETKEDPDYQDRDVILEAYSEKGDSDWYGDFNYGYNPLGRYSNSKHCKVTRYNGSIHGFGTARIRVETKLSFLQLMGWEDDLKYEVNE